MSDIPYSPWIVGPAAFIAWTLLLLLARRILLGALRRLTRRAPGSSGDLLVRALPVPLLIAILASGLVILDRILPLAPEWDRAFDVMLAAALVLALVLFADRACRGLLDRLARDSAVLQGARGLILGVARGLLISLGLLVFLDSVGISITPLLASLGVGSLAVALALQDTLNNLFAGLYLVADKPVEPGHFVRLESGQEGRVTRIGWRSTWIRTLADDVIVVPNARLAGSVIVNRNLPDPESEITVEVGVRYDSDLEKVERVTLEVAREVQAHVDGGVAASEPGVRYHTFADSGIRFNVTLVARSFEATYRLRHEFIKRLTARYRQERIVMPFPTRTIDLPGGRRVEVN